MTLAAKAVEAWLAGDAAGAERLASEALLSQPNDANALQVLASACLRDSRVSQAVDHLRRAEQAAPNNPSILNMLGVALKRTGDFNGARRAYNRAGALGSGEAWRNLGVLERSEHNLDAAMAAFHEALTLQPGDIAAHAGLAQIYEMRHDAARARQHADRALELDPKHEVARIVLGQLAMRERDWAKAEAVLAPLGADGRASQVNRAIAIGLIAETLERRGAIDAAFEAFTLANGLVKPLYAAAANAMESLYHPDTIARLSRFVDEADAREWRYPPRFETPTPVFLVGFPRSGTTLLDQILSSHSKIWCLEEREILAPAVTDLIGDEALRMWRDLPASAINERRRRYWTSVEQAMPSALDGRILVDKLPLNLIALPAIARIFPDALIIFALRDPRDAVLSAYQQRFGVNTAMAQMLELESAGRYYDAAMTLALRCREKLTLRVHEVRYEEVVANLEGAARGLAAFLDVAFEPAMLDFTATARRRDINTPSARQVVQPLYAYAVGRWRAYATHFAPVLPLLNRWAERLGYPP